MTCIRVTSHKLHATSYQLQAIGSRLQVTSCALSTTRRAQDWCRAIPMALLGDYANTDDWRLAFEKVVEERMKKAFRDAKVPWLTDFKVRAHGPSKT